MIHKKRLFTFAIIFSFSLVLVILLGFAPAKKRESELIIYDVHPDSPRIVKDDGSIEFADYVRIKNLSDQPRDLTGLFLTDSYSGSDRLPLDGIVVDGGQSVMIKLDPSWNFALESSGKESVYLSDSKGNILFKYTSDMKPEEPKLSAESGFYDEPFMLTMTVEEDQTIYYTLDGSEPDEDSEKYTEPVRVYDRSSEPNSVVNVPNIIRNYLDDEVDGHPVEQPNEEPVDKAFIIRAVAIDGYGNRSDIVNGEYFFCEEKYKNIISVVANRDDLFGDNGIVSVGKEYDEWYLNGQEGERPEANFNKKGREWEIPAEVTFFRSQKMVFDTKCGLKLFGRTTREDRRKNFQLCARNRYSGSDVFEYDFFEDEEYRPDKVTLDDSFIESFFFSLIDDEDIITHKTSDRYALFLNGELWSSVYVRQKYDEKYFADHFDIDPDNLIVYNDTFPETGYTDEESYEEARQLYLDVAEYAAGHDLSVSENYEKILTMMDMDSYIDYLAINSWIGNHDWNEGTNCMCWRVRNPYDESFGDGRIRWMIHDGDYILHDVVCLNDSEYVENSVILKAMLKNENFRKNLAERIIKLGQTAFSDEHIREELSKNKWDEPEKEKYEEFFKDRKTKMLALADSLKNMKDRK